MWYRIPFFKKLNELFEIKYFFTDFNIIEDIYAESYKNAIKEMERLDYKISGSIFDLAKELFKSLMADLSFDQLKLVTII